MKKFLGFAVALVVSAGLCYFICCEIQRCNDRCETLNHRLPVFGEECDKCEKSDCK